MLYLYIFTTDLTYQRGLSMFFFSYFTQFNVDLGRIVNNNSQNRPGVVARTHSSHALGSNPEIPEILHYCHEPLA